MRNFTGHQEEFTKKTQEFEDKKMKEYIEKGIFNENLELLPKKPKTAYEMELEAVESWNSPILSKAYKYLYSPR